MSKKRKTKARKSEPAPVTKPASRPRKDEDPRRVYLKQCLREWGVWRRSWHCGPGRIVSWWGKLFLDQYMPMLPPLPGREVDEVRAHQTHELVDGLDPLLRLVLLVQYVLGVHGTKEEKARSCGLSSPQRYYDALARAHDAFEIRTTVLSENISMPEINLQKPYCDAGLDSEIIDIVV
jgi:hypothetical protein